MTLVCKPKALKTFKRYTPKNLEAVFLFVLGFSFFAYPANAQEFYQSSSQRGRETKLFTVPGSSFFEECVLPQPILGGLYSSRDQKTEAELCALDFWNKEELVACPKLNSTSPGIDLMEPPQGMAKSTYESEQCTKVKRSGEKVAKFKQSITCSYTPSILGYYHISRLLGGAGMVPPAVVRTMNKDLHWQNVVKRALPVVQNLYRDPMTAIRFAWEKQWTQIHDNPKGDKSKSFPRSVLPSRIYGTDFQSMYGALVENPKKELQYTEVSGRFQYATRYETFQQQPPFQKLIDAKPISQKYGRTLAESAQALIQMKDVSDMILLDQILNQQDRIGNIHYLSYYYWQKEGKIFSQKVKWENQDKRIVDAKQKAELIPFQPVIVKKMMMKDNDCGVAKDNMAKKHRLLEKIRHISPATYYRFLWFAQQLQTQELPAYLKRETLMTTADLTDAGRGLIPNVKAAVTTLKSRCQSGELLLDLSLQDHLAGKLPSDFRSFCELPANYNPETTGDTL